MTRAQPSPEWSGRRDSDVLPHPDGAELADAAVLHAQRLACAVRDDGAWEVARITDGLSRDELVALAVVLAAMVPLDRSVADLLAWINDPLPAGQRFPDLRWSPEALRLAHASWNRGERDPWSTEGERLYQQAAHERKKARKAVDNPSVATVSRAPRAVRSGNRTAPAGAPTPGGPGPNRPARSRREDGFVKPRLSAPRDNTGEAC